MSCISGGKVAEAFQIFEWMVAGCGNESMVQQTPETLRLLFQGCHQTCALEKALEVLSWLHLSRMKPSEEIYSHLEDTIDIVQLWDSNVLTNCTSATDTGGIYKQAHSAVPASGLHHAIMPDSLRPAPFDGKRASYACKPIDQVEARHNFSHHCD